MRGSLDLVTSHRRASFETINSAAIIKRTRQEGRARGFIVLLNLQYLYASDKDMSILANRFRDSDRFSVVIVAVK